MNPIKELWYGNIIPQESGIFNKPQFKELLEKMMVNRNEFDSLAEAEVFEYGFKLGTKLMLSDKKQSRLEKFGRLFYSNNSLQYFFQFFDYRISN